MGRDPLAPDNGVPKPHGMQSHGRRTNYWPGPGSRSGRRHQDHPESKTALMPRIRMPLSTPLRSWLPPDYPGGYPDYFSLNDPEVISALLIPTCLRVSSQPWRSWMPARTGLRTVPRAAVRARFPVNRLAASRSAAAGTRHRRTRSSSALLGREPASARSRTNGPSAERCAQCLLCALAPDGLLVHSGGVGSDPIPGVAAADALQARPGELSAAAW